jgi:hypothetical protein
MEKSPLTAAWNYLRRIHPWYFLILAIIFGSISLVALRHNNEHMIRLRDAVYAADKNDGNVEGALRTLRQYVYSHMNTSLSSGPNAVHPPIQLKYTYERLEAQKQQTLGQNNASVYGAAEQACVSQASTATGTALVACIQNYATAHGINLTNIPEALYEFDFTSAKWSPDLAGWTLLATIILAISFVVSAVHHWIVKKYF